MRAVSESAAVNAEAGRVGDILKDVLNYVHAKKSLCVGWLNKSHGLWLCLAVLVMSFGHLLERDTGIKTSF